MDESFYRLFVKAQSLDDRRRYLLLDGLKDLIFSDYGIEPVADEDVNVKGADSEKSGKKIAKKKK